MINIYVLKQIILDLLQVSYQHPDVGPRLPAELQTLGDPGACLEHLAADHDDGVGVVVVLAAVPRHVHVVQRREDALAHPQLLVAAHLDMVTITTITIITTISLLTSTLRVILRLFAFFSLITPASVLRWIRGNKAGSSIDMLYFSVES